MDERPQDAAPAVAHGEHQSTDTALELPTQEAKSVSDDALKEKLIEILDTSDLNVTTGELVRMVHWSNRVIGWR